MSGDSWYELTGFGQVFCHQFFGPRPVCLKLIGLEKRISASVPDYEGRVNVHSSSSLLLRITTRKG